MPRISIAIDDEGFWEFMHMHAAEYSFDSGYRLRRNDVIAAKGLWYVEDSIGHRLNHEGLWIGQPREDGKFQNWLNDTSHEFRDALNLFQRATGMILRPTNPQPPSPQ